MLQTAKWFIILLLSTLSMLAQDTFTNRENSQYTFKTLKNLEATPIENQSYSGTCWSFSSLSFLESEILRLTNKEVNLSEMYVVRNAYLGKAENYLRMNGHSNFAQGGAFHDALWVWKHYGMMPEHEYMGLNYGYDKHNHSELEIVLKSLVESFNKKTMKDQLTTNWKEIYTGVVDSYLGHLPADVHKHTFTIDGRTYTPFTYAESLGLNPDDYISLTSFTHHPFYEPFVIEIPDNWNMKSSYNLPLDELMSVLEQAIMSGYSFAWGADVSEKGFSARDALAIVPEDEATVKEKGKGELYFTDEDDKKINNAFMIPGKEKLVSQDERQHAFDVQTTTDDHGLHATGIVEDQNGTKYFVMKNSWGTEHNDRGGYFYASFPYVRYKTISVYIHKDALPKQLRKKLGIK
ncbi:MAG: aminopeptidase [Flavobacteriia bacterium]|nr:MAG: aminopeptidase [Flavobacteriia bacterium]